jgi:hypothetical protein
VSDSRGLSQRVPVRKREAAALVSRLAQPKYPALVFYPFNPHTLTDLGELGGGEGGLGSCRRVGVVDVCGAGHLLLVPGRGAGAFRGRFTLRAAS